MSKKNKRLISYLLAVSLVVLVAFLYIHNGGATPREDNVKEIDLAVSELSALKQNEIEGTLVYINSNSLFHLNLATSENKKIVNDVGGTTSPSSENGTFFSLDKQEVYLVNRIGETQETTFDISDGVVPLLSPSGEEAALITFSNAERDFGYKLALTSASGQHIGSIANTSSKITSVSWKDNENLIYCLEKESGSEIWQANKNGTASKIIKKEIGYVRELVATGNIIAYTVSKNAGDNTEKGIKMIKENEHYNLSQTPADIKNLRISNDGNYLVFLSNRQPIIYSLLLDQLINTNVNASAVIGIIK